MSRVAVCTDYIKSVSNSIKFEEHFARIPTLKIRINMLPFYRTETSHPPFAHEQVLTNVCSKISWIWLNHSVPFLIYCTPNAEFIRLNYRSSLSKFCCYVNNDRWNQKGKKSRDFVPVSLDADTENTESVPLSSCAVSRGYEKSLERCTVMLQFKERDTLRLWPPEFVRRSTELVKRH